MMTFTDDRDQGPPSQLPLAAATALLAAAIVAVGLLLMQHDRGGAGDGAVGRNTAASVSLAHVTNAPASAPVRSSAATPADGAARSEREGGTMSIYIAGSPEEADRTRASVHEADAVRLTLGLPPLKVVVVVAGSAEEAVVLRLVADAAAIRETLGLSLPALVVIDLRTP